MAVKFQLRRDTAANWASANTVLDVGEPGFETDTRKLKLGDGVTPWNSLDYTIIQDFDELSNTPTTLAGYGITDAATSAQGALADTAVQPGDNFEGTVTGDVKGSVFGDDSTLIVDAVNNIVTANLTGNVTGNADTATALATARTIAGQSFDGTANITIAATDLSDTDQSLATTDDVTFNSVTGNVFTSLIDSADSSAITITPDLVLSAGLTVGNHIVPSSNSNIDLGSAANRFRDIYLSGNTINLGGTTLSRHTDGSVAINDHSTGNPLPVRASEVVVGEGADKIIIRRTVDGLVEFDSQDADGVSGGLIEGKFSNLRTTGNVQIDGDLVVSGDTTTLTATNLAVSDNMLYLNNAIATTITGVVGDGADVVYTTSEDHGYTQGMTVSISGVDPAAYNLSEQTITAVTNDTFTIANAATGAYVSGGTARARTNANPDLGFAAGYYDGGYGHAGFFRDATDGVFKVFDGYTPEPDESAFIDIADASFNIADIQAGTGYFADISLGGTAVTATAAELNYLDITTLGTVEASKAVTADANGNITTANDLTVDTVFTATGIVHDGDTDTSLKFLADRLYIDVGGNRIFDAQTGDVKLNGPDGAAGILVDTGGNVGIGGITNPTRPLHVFTSSTAPIRIEGESAGSDSYSEFVNKSATAVGNGVGIEFRALTTTQERQQFFLTSEWTDNVDASRESEVRFYTSGSGTQQRPLTLTGVNTAIRGNLLLENDRIIGRDTTDGSDTGYLAVVGGGAESDGRGAIIRYYGNEHATEAGNLALSSGNVSGSKIALRAAGTNTAYVTSTALMVGTTDSTPYNNSAGDTSDNGIALGATGIMSAAKFNDSVLLLNRTGVNDGSIIDVKKNGSTVGTIGTVDGDLNVYATASGHKGLRFGNGYVAPTGNNTTVENGTTDLGLSTHRFKDLYMTGTANASQYILDAINADIADTAVDVFVYDTSKDSDGGSWRKRTQHTSWYNETLNTSTRGSRREFPAVAVIVAESSTVTIYDGDDPDMPMWMVFTGGSGGMANRLMVQTNGDISCVAMLNGILIPGRSNNSASYGIPIINFISEKVIRMDSEAGGGEGGTYTGNIATRNDSTYGYVSSNEDYDIISSGINDVAMKVLPNAPIDSVTGLPIPTIAVTTGLGTSVIKDDGTVVSSSTYDGTRIAWTSENKIAVNAFVNFSPADRAYIIDYPSLSGLRGYYESTTPAITNFNAVNNGFHNAIATSPGRLYGANYVDGTYQHTPLVFVDYDLQQSQSTDMVCYVASTYNTGWMNGNIKLATLSDTDDTDVTGSELVTNGTFDTDSDWTLNTGWSISSGKLRKTDGSNTSALQTINTVIGKTYTISVTIDTGAGGSYIYANGSYTGDNMDSAGDYSRTFTATSTTTQVGITGVTGNGLVADNFSVRLAESDRSVNGNGLQVFGTVTKTSVATGADLVAYSGFANANYLKGQLSDPIGTSDFSFSFWIKPLDTIGGGTGNYFHAISIGTNSTGGQGSGSGIVLKMTTTDTVPSGYSPYFYSASGNDQGTYDESQYFPLGQWSHFVGGRFGGVFKIYINGKLSRTGNTNTYNISDDILTIGKGFGYGEFGGPPDLALARVSKTAPSEEQIAKMYEDEKFLFQENAKCTLYGGSSINALAYDNGTNLLHAGNSSGRNVFQGLRRIDNTTDAVGAAISASNGMVAED